MTRSWQDVQNEIAHRAHMLFAEVMRIRETLPPKELANIMYSKEKDEDFTRTLCRYYLSTALSPDVLEVTQVVQVDGMVGGQLHSWLEVRPDAEAFRQEGLQRLPPNWKFIIDVCFKDVLPPILLISPLSPLQYMYGK
jgi:hypothetical protein